MADFFKTKLVTVSLMLLIMIFMLGNKETFITTCQNIFDPQSESDDTIKNEKVKNLSYSNRKAAHNFFQGPAGSNDTTKNEKVYYSSNMNQQIDKSDSFNDENAINLGFHSLITNKVKDNNGTTKASDLVLSDEKMKAKIKSSFSYISELQKPGNQPCPDFWNSTRIYSFLSACIVRNRFFMSTIKGLNNFSQEAYEQIFYRGIEFQGPDYWLKKKSLFIKKAETLFKDLEIDYQSFKSIESILKQIHEKLAVQDYFKLKSVKTFGSTYEKFMKKFKICYLFMMGSDDVFYDVYYTYRPILAELYPSEIYFKSVITENRDRVNIFKRLANLFESTYFDIKNAHQFQCLVSKPYLCSHATHFFFDKADNYFQLEHQLPVVQECHFYFNSKVKLSGFSSMFTGIDQFTNLKTLCISYAYQDTNYKELIKSLPSSLKFFHIFTDIDQVDLDSLINSNLCNFTFCDSPRLTDFDALSLIKGLKKVTVFKFSPANLSDEKAGSFEGKKFKLSILNL